MKYTFLLTALIIAFMASCEKEKSSENMDPRCNELPPDDELCEAYFTSWFYNAESNSCVQISYSGCSFYGFETKEACENCGCK